MRADIGVGTVPSVPSFTARVIVARPSWPHTGVDQLCRVHRVAQIGAQWVRPAADANHIGHNEALFMARCSVSTMVAAQFKATKCV